jgi:hypothetical protein
MPSAFSNPRSVEIALRSVRCKSVARCCYFVVFAQMRKPATIDNEIVRGGDATVLRRRVRIFGN